MVGAVKVRFYVDFEAEPWQCDAHASFDLVHGFDIVIAVEFAGLHFDAQQNVILRHVHGLHVQQLFHARRRNNGLLNLLSGISVNCLTNQ